MSACFDCLWLWWWVCEAWSKLFVRATCLRGVVFVGVRFVELLFEGKFECVYVCLWVLYFLNLLLL